MFLKPYDNIWYVESFFRGAILSAVIISINCDKP